MNTTNNAAPAATIDATGHTVHPQTSHCPNCHAHNVGRRCNCTVAKHGPKAKTTLDALNAIELVF